MVVTGACGCGTGLLPQLFQEITLGRGNKTFLPGASTCVHTEHGMCPSLPHSWGGSAGLAGAKCVLVCLSSLDKENDLQVGKVNLRNCI